MSEEFDTVPMNAETKMIRMGERGVQLSTLEDAYRFATAVIRSKLAPVHYKSPDQVLIAMQYGAELGLAKMQSLQALAVINGRPALWGDALPALVLSSGKCESLVETFVGDPDTDLFAARCETIRKGQVTPIVREFSIRDAKEAGLWNKAGPWKNYWKRMLQVRARGWCFRDAYADVLCGFGVAEELQDYPLASTEPEPPRMTEADGLRATLMATLRDKVGCKDDSEYAIVLARLDASWSDPQDTLTKLNNLAAAVGGWENIKKHCN